MPYLFELRPSYRNFLEFISCGFRFEFINIYLGFLVIAFLTLWVCTSRQNTHIKLITLYFSLSFFTNFAYQMYRARFFDYIGIVIGLIVISILLLHPLKIWRGGKTLFFLMIILLLHILILYIAGYFDRYESGDKVFLQRMVMIFRVVFLFFVVLYFMNFVRDQGQIDFIVTAFKYTGAACLLIMVFQEILFFGFGYESTCLNFASARIPLPRFGSISIEGGHFGRLIPTFLVYFLVPRKAGLKITAAFFLLVFLSLTNISISLYGYLVFIFLSMIVVNLFVCKIHRLKLFISVLIATIAGASVSFPVYALRLWDKISALLFKYGDQYERFAFRKPGFVYKSLSEFPLGIGFGVSNRHLPDESFTDMGIYALISQTSILSIVIILLFVCYWFLLLRRFIKYKRDLLIKPYAPHSFIMALAIPFIFIFDIVWLYPGYILPFLILSAYTRSEELPLDSIQVK